MRILCPAKLNLYLEILGLRNDGFHELRLINTAVNLCDELEIELEGAEIKVECDNLKVPQDETNLAVKAAQAFFYAFPELRSGLVIKIKKKIPVAGGLGGGSSNAAAALFALNQMTGSHLSREELMDLGAGVGSDVPFFLFRSPALALGRGEKLTDAGPVPDWTFVIAGFFFGVDTSWAFKAWDLTNKLKQDTLNSSNTPKFPLMIEVFRNDLWAVVSTRYPEIQKVKEFLDREGARGAMMSGSGPTVFGVFEDEKKAQRAAELLARSFPVEVAITKSIKGEIFSSR